jgi:hypothetical protein
MIQTFNYSHLVDKTNISCYNPLFIENTTILLANLILQAIYIIYHLELFLIATPWKAVLRERDTYVYVDLDQN